jgi:pyruvate,water dikinase
MRLGSGDFAAAGIGPKASLLDRAAEAGLPVPPGYLVVHGDDPSRFVGLRGPLIVRSAFSSEDGAEASMAGRFRTVLDVAATADAVVAAVGEVRTSAEVLDPEESPGTRLDVLIMEQVAATTSGVAFTEEQFEDDLVNLTSGLADRLMAGQEAGERRLLPKLRRWEQPDRSLEPWAARLSRLLIAVRRLFGADDWDIEWADDGTTCWLVQVRPITASPVRNEAYTVANHKEILPELPSTLMTSIIEAGSPDLLRFWADADPTLPVHRSFVETFLGRPYLNLSMLTDLMRSLGLPTRLVTDSYGGEPDVDIGLRPLRMVAKAPTLLRIGWSQLGAVRSAERAGRAVAEARPAGGGFGDALDVFTVQYVTLVAEMSSLASSLAPPTAVLKTLGVLDAHLAQHRTAATMMLDRLAPLRAAVTAGKGAGDPDFERAWADWLDHHGHRGVFESDIARPRFRDDPGPILAAARAPARESAPLPSSRIRRRLTTPIWLAVKRSMAAREDLRDQSMRGFAATRDHLVALATDAVDRGCLPDVDAIWDLTRDELRSVDHGAVFTADDLAERRAVRAGLLDRRLPDTVHRFDDLDRAVEASAAEQTSTHRGLSLVKGRVVGIALRASEPPAELPAGFDPSSTILVARSVDAGWVPIFGQVAGVAVEIGGDLSHGSIVLRELGVPAVTNLGEIGTTVKTGDRVELRASAGVLEVLSSTDTSTMSTAADA